MARPFARSKNWMRLGSTASVSCWPSFTAPAGSRATRVPPLRYACPTLLLGTSTVFLNCVHKFDSCRGHLPQLRLVEPRFSRSKVRCVSVMWSGVALATQSLRHPRVGKAISDCKRFLHRFCRSNAGMRGSFAVPPAKDFHPEQQRDGFRSPQSAHERQDLRCGSGSCRRRTPLFFDPKTEAAIW